MPALHVFADALKIDVIVHLGRVARHVELQPFRVVVQLLKLQVRLVIEQQIVHLPEFSLSTRSLRRFRSEQCMRMDFLEREVAIDKTNAVLEPLEQKLDRGRRLLAVGALEIAILDHDHRRVRLADGVIDRLYRYGQLEGLMCVHAFASVDAGYRPNLVFIHCAGDERHLSLSQMNLRTVAATRYVTPLREGGSLPAIVEADDDGMYVLKFRGAGQGPKALIAELVAGEIARALGLPVPDIVFIELDPVLARTEPDPEIQELIAASAGVNLGLDYLPGAVMFDPVAEKPDADLASAIVWFDAYVTNVDRTARNPNLLMWHRKLQLVDHGAALYFHHEWDKLLERSQDAFGMIKDHILLPFASALRAADARLSPLITPEIIRNIVALIPDAWLVGHSAPTARHQYRDAYVQHLSSRREPPRAFIEEAIRARSLLV